MVFIAEGMASDTGRCVEWLKELGEFCLKELGPASFLVRSIIVVRPNIMSLVSSFDSNIAYGVKKMETVYLNKAHWKKYCEISIKWIFARVINH